MGVLRTVANKLPQSHMRSINQPDVSFKGPGGRFSDIMNNKGGAASKSKNLTEKSPVKTPVKQEGSANQDYNNGLFSKFRSNGTGAGVSSILMDQDNMMIEERKETSSNSCDMKRATSSRANS